MSNRAARIVGFALLAAMLAAFGAFMVPAHWNSIWMDTGFGGWVVPVANRLTPGSRLYDFGLHSPLPPLPFVLVRVLCPSGAGWITESLLNFGFQAATILILYWAYSRRAGAAVAFAAACATIPVFYALPKAILYDSMAQFLVACVGITAVACAGNGARAGSGDARKASRRLIGFLSFFLALLVLTKQSTAAGAAFGSACLFFLYPRAETPGRRFGNVLLIMASTAVAVLVILLLLSHWVNFSGCIRDVFLTGSEPKGGPIRLAESAVWSLTEMAIAVVLTALIGLLFNLGFGRHLPALQSDQAVSSTAVPGPVADILVNPRGALLAAAGASLIGFFVMVLYARHHGSGALIQSLHLDTVGATALNVSLVLLLLRVGSIFFCGARNEMSAGIEGWEGGFALVFLCAALGHNLSAVVLRWSHDNNPMIFAALACLTGRGARLTPVSPARRPRLTTILPWAGAIVIILALWVPCAGMISMLMQCTEPWPEVTYLDKARLRPDAAGMRELVNTVRALAPDHNADRVLLLPNDPGVEAWFDRPTPDLSSAMIFVDQYWDRYVDDDFARLEQSPPKVIVIGPRGWWRYYGQHWQQHRGTERLIDLVQDRLLPRRYRLYQAQEINFQGGKDFMDVYVRVDQ